MDDKLLAPHKFGSVIAEKTGIPAKTKAYRRAGSIEEISNSPIDFNIQNPPYIYGFVLYDGDTYGIEEFFSLRIFEIGKAAGKYIEIVDIGDPMQHDNIYGEMLTSKKVLDTKKLAQKYRHEVSIYGSERHLKIMYQQSMIYKFKVDKNYLPCILFMADQNYGRIGLFIKHKWYDYPETARIFSKELQNFFKGLDWQELLAGNVTKAQLHQRFKNKLLEWERCLDERIGDFLLTGISEARTKLYCKAFKDDSVIYLSKIEYNELANTKCDFDLFIDGLKLEYQKYKDGALIGSGTLTYSEFQMLVGFIKKGDFIKPYGVRVKDDQNYDAANKMFKELRKKIDIKLNNGKYHIFKHYLTEDTSKTGYKFDPPEDFKYCIIQSV